MAWQREHICEECGYVATTYEGKGLFGQHITAVACPDCRSIGNLVVGGVIGDVAPSFRSEVGRLCPNCGSENVTASQKKNPNFRQLPRILATLLAYIPFGCCTTKRFVCNDCGHKWER